VNQNGRQTELTNKRDIETAIIAKNRQKYHQTEHYCPFLCEPLLSDFGQFGEGPATEQVLHGTYNCPQTVDKYTQEYLRLCQLSTDKAKLQQTPHEFKQGWKKIDERISSRLLHFGHFKAACKHDVNILVHYTLVETPFRSGYSPQQWKNATNVMILKKAGIFDINKLRTIVLFEADFNQNNKHFGRSIMTHTVSNGSISKEQYSVPGKNA
jgi:hypothetical protein